ncbi:MAG: hypothetical protein AAF720_02625 [Pseudomonadota bacterium]
MTQQTKAPDANAGGREVSKEVTSARTSFDSKDSLSTADVNEAVAFLRKFRPGGPWVLTSIVPDGRISTTTFRDEQQKMLQQWLEGKVGRKNVYFQVNATGEKNITKKTTKADIIAAEWLHVDVDPNPDEDFDKARASIFARLNAFNRRPQLIIDSGGGFQAFWRIVPTDDLEDVEAINRWIEQQLGGDHCHNIDRIMRLPGTINLPNKRKREKGRAAAPTRLTMFEEGITCTDGMGRVDKAEPPRSRGTVHTIAEYTGPTDALFLCEVLPPWAFRLLNDARDVNGQPFKSRSQHVLAFVGACVRDEVVPELIRWCLTNPAFAVSAHILDQKNPDRAIARAIAFLEANDGQG